MADHAQTAELTGRAAIRWPPRVTKSRIRKLYQSIPDDRLDEQMVDDVGISLYMRCRAIMTISEAKRGRVLCPVCERAGKEIWIARLRHAREETLRCPQCAWEITWLDYLRSYQRKQFNEGGAGAAFHRYLEQYPKCKTPWEKMLEIDFLIHQFHFSLREDLTKPTRAVCVNLIDGKLGDVVAFLNEISGCASGKQELSAHHRDWQANCQNAGDWHPK